MHIPKTRLITSITAAQKELGGALRLLESLPAFDPGTVGYAAHAIHNYLAIAHATLDLLEPALAGHANADLGKWVATLRQSTVLMDHTVSRLVNASVSKEVEYLKAKVNIVRLVEIGCEYYRTVAARKQIRIGFVPEVEAAYIETDPVVAGAVLDNLLSNAVKFSDPGTHIQVGVAREPDCCICHVQDHGPGLSETDQKQLFQPGALLGPRPTGGETSSGIGLAIAKEMVEKLGGRIWCESAPGIGSRFSFSLPANHGGA